MTHPEELLAGYVDGSLTDPDRTAVDVHLLACARCRAEVELAATARAALRLLPQPATPDLAAAVMAEVGASPAVGPAGPPHRYRYVGLAAAAAIAVAIVVSLPKIGSGPAQEQRAGGASAAAPTLGEADTLAGLTLELQQVDYDAAAVQTLAGEATRVATPSEAAAGSAAMAPVGTPAQASRAQACVEEAFPKFPGAPIRLISATFEGTPAYLAVVLEGPAPGQPADTVSVWVVDRASCQPLSFATTDI